MVDSTKRDRTDQTIRTWNTGRMTLLLLGMLTVGVIGYVTATRPSLAFVFAHLGGAGILGLLAIGAADIAVRKGYDSWRVFSLALLLPIFVGTVAVLLFQPTSCGGSPSLLSGVLAVVVSALIKRNNVVSEP